MTNASSSLPSASSPFWGVMLPQPLQSLLEQVDWRTLWPAYVLLLVLFCSRLPALLERFSPAPSKAAKGFVVPAVTNHARYLPSESQHAFRYNTLYLAVRLDALENHELDVGHAFSYKGSSLETEFVEDVELAKDTHIGQPKQITNAWKEQMRVAERIHRRKRQEKLRRNDAFTWSWTALHPASYLRTEIPITNSPANTENQDRGTASTTVSESKRKWIQSSILLKLAYELREKGFLSSGPQDDHASTRSAWREELGDVWTVTMPSVAGITGINPLTVHYCYRKRSTQTDGQPRRATDRDKSSRGKFWLIVLEVHNTFSERHIYVLEAGKGEDAPDEVKGSAGCDHIWTFPRSFHVSPFNDRGGFYRLYLKEPFRHSSEEFCLGIRLLLLVEDPSVDPKAGEKQPALVKKLMATLDSPSPSTSKANRKSARRVRPLSTTSLYAALMRQPFDLFLTFFRILWEAGKLHFSKKLAAFGRPDMVQAPEEKISDSGISDTPFSCVGLPPPINKIEVHRQNVAAKNEDATVGSQGLVYPEPGFAEKIAKRQLEAFARKRVKQLRQTCGENWSFKVVSTDPMDHGIEVESSSPPHKDCDGKQKKLILYTRSYSVYTDLLTYSQPRLALLAGSLVGRRWGVSSLDEFDNFFQAAASSAAEGSIRSTMADRIRAWYESWLLSFSVRQGPCLSATEITNLLESFGVSNLKLTQDDRGGKGKVRYETASNPITKQIGNWKTTSAVLLGVLAAVGEQKVFAWLGAKYVPGTEPWLEIRRGLDILQQTHDAGADGTAAKETEVSSIPNAVKPSWDTKLGSVRSDSR